MTDAGSRGAATHVVMFVYDDVTFDTRVRREARSLVATGRLVTIVGRPTDLLDTIGDEVELDGIRVIRVPLPHRWRRAWRIAGAPLRWIARAWARVRGRRDGGRTLAWLLIWRFATVGWASRAAAAAPDADVVHGHDLSGLIAAARSASRPWSRPRPIVYDSHELFVEAGGVARQPAWARRWLARTERRLAREAAAVITVNAAIADELVARYAIALPTLVHNCPPRPVDEPDRILLRDAAGLAPDVPIVLCHGGLGPKRGVEETALALLEPGLAAAHLVLLGRSTSTVESILGMPGLTGRVHLLPPVPPDDVVDWISGADVASMPIQPTSLNHRLSTPNKLFESLAAGVPVVSSDFPVRRAIVMDDPGGPLGAVCDPSDPVSVAAAIRSILERSPEDRAALRNRCRNAARERWNWESEGARLIEVYERIEIAR